MKQRKKSAFPKMLVALAALCGLIAADSSLRLVTTEYVLDFDRLPADFDGFRIVQLSDVHGAVFGQDNARLLARVAALEPDLIALTGDLADENTRLADTETLLRALSGIAPCFFVSGNHEWSAGLIQPLRRLCAQCGVRWLHNEYLTLKRGGSRIVLAGVEDPQGPRDMTAPDALIAAARGEYPEDFLLLLAHRNDYAEKYPALPVDLILSGHAHGGMIRLPGLGGVLGHGGALFPDYEAGVYAVGSYRLVVSRGIGLGMPLPRFLNNPEVVCVTLKRA